MDRQEFEATLEADERGIVRLRMPFNPTEKWGKKARHYIAGTINGMDIEGSLGSRGGNWFFPVNKALQKRLGAAPGDAVRVALGPADAAAPEVPEDLATAIDATPPAKAFFDGLSGFYQREYVGWVEGAKAAKTREARVRQVVELLKQERKQR